MSGHHPFEPTHAAARARLAAVSPGEYARTRNRLDGRVTRLSPYVTHGLLTIPQALEDLGARHRLSLDDKLVFEFGWREFFHHAWRHLGDGILEDVRPPVWPGRYADAVPDDVLEARTGVPAVDSAVRELCETGWLHNHARMWLASYLVHLRKVSWRAGAGWMFGQLLDGDLASNHLSWQWVAGTFSAKPYLFNADNVARYAPAGWHSPGTAIDRSYAELEQIARHGADVGLEPRREAGRFLARDGDGRAGAAPPQCGGEPIRPPAPIAHPPEALLAALPRFEPSSAPSDGPIRLVHPWDLAERVEGDRRPRVGWIHLPFHRRLPWSGRRWSFVLAAMSSCCDAIWLDDGDAPLPPAIATATLNPGYRERLREVAGLLPAPRRFPDPERLCSSFSRFWTLVRREAGSP